MANVRRLTINPPLTEAEFAGFCAANPDLEINRDSSGIMIIRRQHGGRDDYSDWLPSQGGTISPEIEMSPTPPTLDDLDRIDKFIGGTDTAPNAPLDLDGLIAQITPASTHSEVPTGPEIGREERSVNAIERAIDAVAKAETTEGPIEGEVAGYGEWLLAHRGKVSKDIEFRTWSLQERLGGIGYPGYEYSLREARAIETATLLLDALSTDDLDQRVVEALPWVLANRRDLNWNYLIEEARSRGHQNRLGYLLEVTAEALKKSKLLDIAAELEPWLIQLRDVRIDQECTLCKDSMTQVERRRIRRESSQIARYWRVVSDMNAQQVAAVLRKVG